MIDVDDIYVSYDRLKVLRGVSLTVSEDDSIVTIVGPNGAGKTTLMRAISGLHPIDAGSITLWGDDIKTLDAAEIVRKRFTLVSEERNLFPDMTVRENLEMGAYQRRENLEQRLEEMYELFPVLEERSEQRAGSMSGGEQQMVALARGLMSEPKILALDEPSEGLAPQIADRMFERIKDISEETTVLLVEQHVDEALSLAKRAYLLENGRIVREDTGRQMLESDYVQEAYL